ncbi:PP2C family protein-serine/threonine phosphatase [Streptosporangium vulgare]|uniref:PP2C family protein-serine/threonine phosphatase n=1 Tax=Streptosporangium vulgare TaxID=46190 RepID=UPI0031DDB905
MTAPANETLTLLLIEDDAGDAFLVEELLSEADNPPKIIWVRSMAESRERLTEDVQCVLVDLSLPDASGLEALEQVLSMAPHAAVLVLTGLNDTHVGVEAVAAGAQDFLVKQDVEARLLARAIRYSIERKRADLAQRRLVEAELLTKENSRLERGLLPVPLLASEVLDHQARYLPGRRRALLAGDFWDTVQSPDGAVHVVVGDVCGHGPDEAALGVALRIAWRTLVLAGHTGNELLSTLEAVLRLERKSAEIFTTLCIVTIDPTSARRGSAAAADADHVHPRRAEGVGIDRDDAQGGEDLRDLRSSGAPPPGWRAARCRCAAPGPGSARAILSATPSASSGPCPHTSRPPS